eukprot:TRINITY_DN7108_c0_g1_i1.p2 TRINITY_DN7108_c0_g1~~TRINITY_DN7108_c0_g1_i1.p2  ORF type:complete len:203 (-),score=66.95 TRINITY_DN7108_c0_g1_i1:10-618(-)
MSRAQLRQASIDMLESADEAYKQAIRARPSYTVAMNNHGLALSTLAKWTEDVTVSEALFGRAYRMFAFIATPLRPSSFHCQSNFAMTLAAQARMQQLRGDADGARRRLRMATAKLRPLLMRGDAWASFCMARVHAVAGRFELCREWLQRCAHRNYLGRATPSQLAFFAPMLDVSSPHHAWFDEMLQKARKAAIEKTEMGIEG